MKRSWWRFFRKEEKKRLKAFNAASFDNLETLIARKRESNKKLVLCIPVTKGERTEPLLNELKVAVDLKDAGLLDRVIVGYGGGYNEVIPREAKEFDGGEEVDVIFTRSITVPDMLPAQVEKGKGADMRRIAYHVTSDLIAKNEDLGDWILGFIDGDILAVSQIDGQQRKIFGAHFVTSLFGPFLVDAELKMVSLAYCRPQGFARVNKLIAQPLFSLVKDSRLDAIRPPYVISGEKAWDLQTLLTLRFRQKYGEEMQKWFDAAFKLSPSEIATVNVGFFDHKHQAVDNLRTMSFGIMRTWLENMLEHGVLKLGDGVELTDVLEYSEINLRGKRVYYRKEFEEKTYAPLSVLFEKGLIRKPQALTGIT
ncbi:MAG: hypothetical protein ACE5E0_01180 [Terriglobia bacterium]